MLALTRLAYLAAIAFASPVLADEIELAKFGMRAEAVVDGFSRITSVQEFGPAWHADFAAGDIVRNDLRGLRNQDDRNYAAPTGGERAATAREVSVQRVDTLDEDDINRASTTRIDLTLIPFDGGRWFDDAVRPSERARTEPGLDTRVATALTYSSDLRAAIAEVSCTDGKLRPEDRFDLRVRAFQADGYARAAALPMLPSADIVAKVQARDRQCRQENAAAIGQENVVAFQQFQAGTRGSAVDFPELGLRVFDIEIEGRQGRMHKVSQIVGVEENGPFWRYLGVKPGDMILFPSNALQHKLGRIQKAWDRLQPGTPRVVEWPLLELGAPYPTNTPFTATIEVVEWTPSGIWHTDPLAAHDRAALTAGDEALNRYFNTLDDYTEELTTLACDGTFAVRKQMTAELERLYILAGFDTSASTYEGDLTRTSRVACENATMGPVSNADFERMTLIRTATYHTCTDDGGYQTVLAELRRDMTRANYRQIAEFSIRELLASGKPDDIACVVSRIKNDVGAE